MSILYECTPTTDGDENITATMIIAGRHLKITVQANSEYLIRNLREITTVNELFSFMQTNNRLKRPRITDMDANKIIL